MTSYPLNHRLDPQLQAAIELLTRRAEESFPERTTHLRELPPKARANRILQALASLDANEPDHDELSDDLIDSLLDTEAPEAVLRHDPRCRTPLLARRLLLRARAIAGSAPEVSRKLVDLALRTLDRVDDPGWGADYLWTIRIEARVVRVEALYSARDLHDALSEARPLLAAATPEIGARLRGDVHMITALIYRSLGELDEAEALLVAARDLYALLEAPTRLARALLHLAELHRLRGDLAAAVKAARQAVQLFKAEKDPHAVFCARHNLALYLCQDHHPVEARRQLELSRVEYRGKPHSVAVLTSRWVEARIHETLGQADSALSIYREVQSGFLAEGSKSHPVEVSLDLASLLIGQGRFSAARSELVVMEARIREAGLGESLVRETDSLVEELDRAEPSLPRLRRGLLRLRAGLQRDHGSRESGLSMATPASAVLQ